MSAFEGLRVVDLRTDAEREPRAIDRDCAVLSWCVESSVRATTQSAYRLEAATSPQYLTAGHFNIHAGRWKDSGDQRTTIETRHLTIGSDAWWRVWIRDNLGREATSEQARFTVGLRDESDWRGATWITLPRPVSQHLDHRPAALLRATFHVRLPARRASLWLTAAGVTHAWMNGSRVSDFRFSPGWTDYNKQVQYELFDVVSLLRPGENVIGCVLGEGWWSGYVGWEHRRALWGDRPALRALLVIEGDVDGVETVVVTGGAWQGAFGSILSSELLHGETSDLRLCRPGWNEAVEPIGQWVPVEETAGPRGRLCARRCPPVRVVETLPVRRVGESPPGSTIYDVGRNVPGWARIRMNGGAGDVVRLRFAELLGAQGGLDVENLVGARCTDLVIDDGTRRTWEPEFTYRGYRYLEVTGPRQPLPSEAVEARIAHTDLERSGVFRCSNAVLNEIYEATVWTARANTFEVPTDCPQHDERLGWLGDAHLFAPTQLYTFDAASSTRNGLATFAQRRRTTVRTR